MRNAVKYLVRLDDACPTMDHGRWHQIEEILDKYEIKPLVGIIPNNADLSQLWAAVDEGFWHRARRWQEKAWSIGLHGYDHRCVMKTGGINAVHARSEFAGLSLEEQGEKLEKGEAVLENDGVSARYFIAPSHTFDERTLKALEERTRIRRVSDTFARFPFARGNLVFYPAQFGAFRRILVSGYWTFCFHPSTMDSLQLRAFERFVKRYQTQFISFDDIDITRVKQAPKLDRLLNHVYLLYRRAKSD